MALVVVVAFAAFWYRGVQNSVGRKVAEARAMQSYAEQGRHALVDGKHGEALIYFSARVSSGDDSQRAAFMRARAAQPFLSTRARLSATSGRTWSAMFSSDGRWILTTDDKGGRLWDASNYGLLAILPHDNSVYNGMFTPDGTKVATAGMDGVVKIWDLAGNLIFALTPPNANRARYDRIAMSPDGRLIAAIDQSGSVAHVWNAATGEFVIALPNVLAWSSSLVFSPDSHWLATSGGDDALLFDTATWKLVARFHGPQIRSLAFDPTGPRMATASGSGDASIWAIPSGERIRRLHEAGARINQIIYSPNGAHLAAASQDGSERVWNSSDGALLLELKNHHGNVPWIEFDNSSRLVLSAGADGVEIGRASCRERV